MAYHSPLCSQRYFCRHAILVVTYQALEDSMHAKVICVNIEFLKWIQPFLTQQKQTSNQYMILTLNYQTIVICNTITHNHFTFYSKARSGAKRCKAQRVTGENYKFGSHEIQNVRRKKALTLCQSAYFWYSCLNFQSVQVWELFTKIVSSKVVHY